MNATITLELSTEDRARIDRILDRLDSLLNGGPVTLKSEPVAVSEPTEAVKEEPQANTQPTAETATAETVAEQTPTEEPVPEPGITFDQIQPKVLQLVTADGGAKKARVREIINAYGAKVSDLIDKPEVWDEVWARLTALESEE